MGYVVEDKVRQPLYVICCITNHERYKARYKHYERFVKHITDAGAILYTVEAAFGERDFAVDHVAPNNVRTTCPAFEKHGLRPSDEDDDARLTHRYFGLRTKAEIWHKEALLNYGISRLPPSFRYVGWCDSDIVFSRPNIISETLAKLQQYDVVQMFSHAQDLGPDYQALSSRPGFVYAYQRGDRPVARYYYGGGRRGIAAWSGLCWAARRKALEDVGGLLDFAITGASDWYMAWALVGKLKDVIPHGSHPTFARWLKAWESKAERHIRRNVGYVSGTVSHMWHGKKVDRKYMERSQLLSTLQFNPETDIQYDTQGLYRLVDDGSPRFIELRDGIRRWFQSRNEDSIDL